MNAGISDTLQVAVTRLLRPLVRILLRYGIPYGVFADIAKRAYVDVAMTDFEIPGRKQTISRASVITGLSRKEITRIRRLPHLSDQQIQDRYNRAVRVISGWTRDEAFNDTAGEPKPLPLSGDEGSFTQLVEKYSGDVPVRAILDELLRVGAVEQSASGEIRLMAPAYIPETGLEDKIGILGTDVGNLIGTIDHNLTHSGAEARLQLKVAYDNIPQEPLHQFRALSAEQSFNMLRLFDDELSQIDRDVNPESEGTGQMRAGISVYYFEEDFVENDGNENR